MELIFAPIIGLIPAIIAYKKGYNFFPWWIYGTLLFIVAIVHVLLIKPSKDVAEREMLEEGMKKCPFCGELIRPEAIVCRYCGRDQPQLTTAPVMDGTPLRHGTAEKADRGRIGSYEWLSRAVDERSAALKKGLRGRSGGRE